MDYIIVYAGQKLNDTAVSELTTWLFLGSTPHETARHAASDVEGVDLGSEGGVCGISVYSRTGFKFV